MLYNPSIGMNAKSLAENMSESSSIGVDLQMTDARGALTFLDLTETTHVAETDHDALPNC
ncbi:MAG: hypothetical protein ACRYGF_08010 [Janthinobacterium lividum]